MSAGNVGSPFRWSAPSIPSDDSTKAQVNKSHVTTVGNAQSTISSIAVGGFGSITAFGPNISSDTFGLFRERSGSKGSIAKVMISQAAGSASTAPVASTHPSLIFSSSTTQRNPFQSAGIISTSPAAFSFSTSSSPSTTSAGIFGAIASPSLFSSVPKSQTVTFGGFSSLGRTQNADSVPAPPSMQHAILATLPIPGLMNRRPPPTKSAAEKTAQYLEDQRAIRKTIYPGLSGRKPPLTQSTMDRFVAKTAGTVANKRRSSSTSSPSTQLSPAIVNRLTALKLCGVPNESNTQAFLREIFKIYGRVVRVTCQRAGNEATVEFADHKAARNAKLKGKVLRPNTDPIFIQWDLTPELRRAITAAKRTSSVLLSRTVRNESMDTTEPTSGEETSGDLFGSDESSVLNASAASSSAEEADSTMPDFNSSRSSASATVGEYVSSTQSGSVNATPTATLQELRQLRSAARTAPRAGLFAATANSSASFVSSKPSLSTHQHQRTLRDTKTRALSTKKSSSSSEALDKAHAIIQDLKKLHGRRATTVAEKYEILEERDKIIRKGRRKQTGVGLGSCPDMCPEKERYQREIRQQVSSYEGEGGIMDPRRAIKDYTRSAADQEEPLPHEMRPNHVLQLTMVYLLTRLVGVNPPPDSEVVLWYDFLWKRTRAVRKDLTQQQICDKSAVELFEQITRFHIFAGFWLSTLDIVDFDQRINIENLSKCLQSLHQLYEDLGKRGVVCETEPEFRAYKILLNLLDSNVLSQVLSWSPRVRESSEVRFALRLLSAVQNKGYVRFFRLMSSEATYLQACIAHRYFLQVRKQALSIMVRSYGLNQPFPIPELEDLLGFETQSECVDFVSLYGLTVTDQDGPFPYVLLNRTSFGESETAPSTVRSFRLVESKRGATPLCQIIYGHPLLPAFAGYHPVNSFDASGHYVNDPVLQQAIDTVELRLQDEEEEDEPADFSETRSDSRRSPVGFEAQAQSSPEREESLQAIARSSPLAKQCDQIVDSIVDEQIRAVIDAEITSAVAEHMLNDVIEQQCREIGSKVYTPLRDACSLIEEVALKSYLELVATVVTESVEEIAKQELCAGNDEYVEKTSTEFLPLFVDACVDEMVGELCAQIYASDVVRKREILKVVTGHLQTMKLRHLANRWRSVVRKSSHKKRLLDEFPLIASSSSVEKVVSRLGIKKRQRRLQPSTSAENLAALADFSRQMQEECCQTFAPFNLTRLVELEICEERFTRFNIVNEMKEVKAFRLVILLLADLFNCSANMKMAISWLRSKFQLVDGISRLSNEHVSHNSCICWDVELMSPLEQDSATIKANLASANACLLFCDASFYVDKIFLHLEDSFRNANRIRIPTACVLFGEPSISVQPNLSSFLELLDSQELVSFLSNARLSPDWHSSLNSKEVEHGLKRCIDAQNETTFMLCTFCGLLKESLFHWIFIPLSIRLKESGPNLSPEIVIKIVEKTVELMQAIGNFLSSNILEYSAICSKRFADEALGIRDSMLLSKTECSLLIDGVCRALLEMKSVFASSVSEAIDVQCFTDILNQYFVDLDQKRLCVFAEREFREFCSCCDVSLQLSLMSSPAAIPLIEMTDIFSSASSVATPVAVRKSNLPYWQHSNFAIPSNSNDGFVETTDARLISSVNELLAEIRNEKRLYEEDVTLWDSLVKQN